MTKKSRKILKKMAKLEKLHKYNIEEVSSSNKSSNSDSSGTGHSSRCHDRSRSSSTSSSSSSSCSSRSPSPQHHRHGHLVISRSLFYGRNCSSLPISREYRRHHRRHDYFHHREFYGKPHHHHHHHHYFRRCNNIVEGGLFRYLALSDNLQNDRQHVNREAEVIDLEMDNSSQETTGDLENQADGVAIIGLELEKSLTENWIEVIQNGLPDNKLRELARKYPVSRNHDGLSLQGPKLNKEIAYIVSDAVACKDASKLVLQNSVGTGLSALGQAISSLNNKSEIKQDIEIIDIVEKLSDAVTILLGTHYNISKMRQSDIKGELRLKAQTVLDTCKHDEFLFGQDLEEKAMNAKGFEKYKKIWKNGNDGGKIRKHKNTGQESEKRKFKRCSMTATSN